MSAWEEFEIDATKYLNDTYGELAEFTHAGGSDSTIPDIRVETKRGNKFYIEAKLSKAQCGQFVLQADKQREEFNYTAKNPINDYAVEIMNFMNSNFDEFANAGTSGNSIEMDKSVFANWIKANYAKKGVKWFISEGYVLIPIDEFEEYFDVTATYRVKKSGSSDAPKSNMAGIIDCFSNEPISFKIQENKLLAFSSDNLHKRKFIYEGNEYMFSKKNDFYVVKKLSHTFHANVIFSVTLKNKADKYKNAFISYLKFWFIKCGIASQYRIIFFALRIFQFQFQCIVAHRLQPNFQIACMLGLGFCKFCRIQENPLF